MKNKSIFILFILLQFITTNIHSQCTASPVTPGSSSTCYNFSSYTSYSGSSPCSGAGFGGSGAVKVIPFCTNSTASCIQFSLSGMPATNGISFAIYSSCTGSPPSLSGYVSGSAQCYSGSSSLVYTTAGLALAPNTCYYIYLWAKDGFPAGSNFCTQTNPATNDYCTNPMSLGTSPIGTNNFCMTAGSDGSYTEPPPSQFCAGSLENNAWYTFQTDCSCTSPCQVTGTVSNISCTGGGAGFQLGFWTGSCSALSYSGCASGSGGTVTFTLNNLSPCQQVIMGMDGNAGANCQYTITMSNVTPLPIELIGFYGIKMENKNKLVWSSATEKNNNYYTLEKSPDGVNFHVWQKVPGAGNSYVQKNYEIIDDEPYNGITYYQLSQTDYDGTTKKLGIVSVQNSSTAKTIELYPNPATESAVLIIPSFKEKEVMISISDISGKLLEISNTQLETGDNYFNLNVASLEKGMYFISIKGRDTNQSFKLIKE